MFDYMMIYPQQEKYFIKVCDCHRKTKNGLKSLKKQEDDDLTKSFKKTVWKGDGGGGKDNLTKYINKENTGQVEIYETDGIVWRMVEVVAF